MFFQDIYSTLQSFWNIEVVTKDKWEEYWNELNESVNYIRKKYNSALANNFTDALLNTMCDKSVGKDNECKCVLDVRLVNEK